VISGELPIGGAVVDLQTGEEIATVDDLGTFYLTLQPYQALALLVRDPRTRARHLPQALRHFAAGDPKFPAGALVPALTTDPDPVLEAFRERLRGPGAGEALRTLADVTTPALALRVAALVLRKLGAEERAALAYVDVTLPDRPVASSNPIVSG